MEGNLEVTNPSFGNEFTIISYVGDILIITKATLNNCMEYLDSFDKYKKCIDLQVNIRKSSIMLSPNI